MPKKIAFADALSGVAALSVVVAHYVVTFWHQGPLVARISNTPPLPPNLMPAISHLALGRRCSSISVLSV